MVGLIIKQIKNTNYVLNAQICFVNIWVVQNSIYLANIQFKDYWFTYINTFISFHVFILLHLTTILILFRNALATVIYHENKLELSLFLCISVTLCLNYATHYGHIGCHSIMLWSGKFRVSPKLVQSWRHRIFLLN